ncbi:MAG: ergothioneine biosynthesis protein EgtB [Alphaproteobacteria bacterium]
MDDISQIKEHNILFEKFISVRNYSLKLIESLSPEDMVVQTQDYVSPIKWHLGHTTWFFEKFILIPFSKNYKKVNKIYDYIFNSYYLEAGNFNHKSKRGFLNRPLLNEVMNYRNHVDENIYELLSNKNDKEIRFILELGLNHEQQHQELILMDIKNIFYNNPLKLKFTDIVFKKNRTQYKNEYLSNKEEMSIFGYDSNGFSYDNEKPSFNKKLSPFKIKDFVTNKEWKSFIDAGGYEDYRYWLSDGWDYIKNHNIKRPMYWEDDKYIFTLKGLEKIDDDMPVSHISFYEAQAYANFKKSRLPTEFELELVLQNSQGEGNLAENGLFSEISYKNIKYKDCFFGNLWVWSSSNYNAYKNYKPFENKLAEYNSKFMCNQFVLKGGAFATPRNHIRASYRNFYYPSDRWQFCGLRLAEDLC